MYDIDTANFLFNEPVKIQNNVYINIPKVKDVIKDSAFSMYSKIFTIQTREIFVLERNVDALEAKYPTVWEFMWDEQADNAFGRLFDSTSEKTFSQVVIDGLSYWTGLEITKTDKDGNPLGFVKLGNGKLMHVDAEWIIDRDEFINFCQLIRYITAWKQSDNLAPTITSDAKHKRWLNHYKHFTKYNKRKSVTWADRILMLSVSGGSYISPDDIKEMTIFHFEHLINAYASKDAYNIEFEVFVSPKFVPPEGQKAKSPKHWKERFSTGYSKYIQNNDE